MTLARRSRSASACFAIARTMPGFKSTCLISTLVTLIPQFSVCSSNIWRRETLSFSRSAIAEREKLNVSLRQILEEQTENWGIKVTNVEIKQVDLNPGMVRAIAKQAEAERDRRAKVIHAEGEYQASENLLKAAQVLAKQPQTMILRYLQTLGLIAEEQNSTIVFPLPIELMKMLEGYSEDKKK